jgi:5-methylcytosine-specific restriction endonuclease McrA
MPQGIKGFQKGNSGLNTGRTRFKKGVSSWNKGKPTRISEETRKKISQKLKGIKRSAETNEKHRIIMLGNKLALGSVRSLETRQKIANSIKGENHYNWKGGITPLVQKIRGSLAYKNWRKAVFKRDDYTCILCGAKEHIEADHIKRFAYYPELRFNVDNGRTLCHSCHKATETYAGKTKSFYSTGSDNNDF